MLTVEQKTIFTNLIYNCEQKAILLSGMMDHLPQYREVVRIAKEDAEYIPILFRAVKNEFRWSRALREIIGDGPDIPKEDAGRVKKLIEYWLQFGKEKGFINGDV